MKSMLRAILSDRSDFDLRGYGDPAVRHAIDVGLGPALYRVTRHGERGVWQDLLRAQDLAARVLSLGRLEGLEEILATAPQDLVAEVLLLKGMSLCQRVYPEAHLRMMGDIDLLVPAALQDRMEEVLHKLGYTQRSPQRPEFYVGHHHSMPFVHPASGLVVEVHTGLFPAATALGAVELFRPESIRRRGVAHEFRGFRMRRLDDETELAYLAAHWIRERRCFGTAVIPILDLAWLIGRRSAEIDWDGLLGAVRDSAAASSLRVALGFLHRRVGIELPIAVRQRLARLVSRPGVAVDPLLHWLVERHALRAVPFGKFWTRNMANVAWEGLMTPHAGWVNILALPWRLAFPPGHPRRYDLGFQLRRVASPVRRRSKARSQSD